MVRPDRDALCGTVEVDETYIGGRRSGKRGRGTENKVPVEVAVEDKSRDEDRKGIGRIRLKRVPDAGIRKPILGRDIIGGNSPPEYSACEIHGAHFRCNHYISRLVEQNA